MPKTITGGQHHQEILTLEAPTILDGGGIWREATVITNNYSLILRAGVYRGMAVVGSIYPTWPPCVKLEDAFNAAVGEYVPVLVTEEEAEGPLICTSCHLAQDHKTYFGIFNRGNIEISISGSLVAFTPGETYGVTITPLEEGAANV